jgi:hypothetical protein
VKSTGVHARLVSNRNVGCGFWRLNPPKPHPTQFSLNTLRAHIHSILSAVLFHFAYNFTFSLVHPVLESIHLHGTLLILIMAGIVMLLWHPEAGDLSQHTAG